MTRLERYDIFKEFFENAGEIFEEIDNNYKQHDELRKKHGFYIAPGSAMGGQDTTVVEVFYGHRPYHSSKKIKNMRETTEVDIAYGTRLHYFQVDNGYIFITLYPAYTEKHKAQEEFICLDFLKKPSKLLDKKYITRQFNYLVSYLAVTSIDDAPKVIDRLRIFYLRTVKKYYIGKVTYDSKLKINVYKALKLIFTVGFSGILLAFLPLFINMNKNKEIEKQINILTEKQNEIIYILKTIRDKPTDDYHVQIEDLYAKLEEISESIKKIKKEE